MTQVSRRILDRKAQERMQEIFLDALGKIHGRQQVSDFIKDFLTPTEQIMLPKRLAIAYLLTRGFDQRRIAQYLKVSNTTITRVSTAMKLGGKGYGRVIDSLLNDKAMKEFLFSIDDAIEKLLGGMPMGPGSSNWRKWRQARFQSKQDAETPF